MHKILTEETGRRIRSILSVKISPGNKNVFAHLEHNLHLSKDVFIFDIIPADMLKVTPDF